MKFVLKINIQILNITKIVKSTKRDKLIYKKKIVLKVLENNNKAKKVLEILY